MYKITHKHKHTSSEFTIPKTQSIYWLV